MYTIFIALEAVKGFLDGHVADVRPESEEQRTNQYLSDVAQENVERPSRGETTLDPNAPATRERWNASQVSNHDSLFSFSDNIDVHCSK